MNARHDPRAPLDLRGALLMIATCVCWSFHQIAIKLAAPSVPLLTQASLRSGIASLLVLAWARHRRVALSLGDGTLWPGLLAGFAFGGEFALIYAGLGHTTASRMVVFLYLTPCLTALGLSLCVPGERLRPAQWLGIVLAFTGIAVAFGESALASAATILGDAMGFFAAVLWSATTVLIRTTSLARAAPTKVLLYQLVVSAAMLPVVSHLAGEPPVREWTGIAVASIAFQTVVVAFASYLAWFWLLAKYLAARLAVFSFLTPLFGVIFGWWVLGEKLLPGFLVAVALVAAGIVLVNRGPRTSSPSVRASGG